MKSKIEILLYNLINDPKDALYNFNLGYEYETLGHTASASSYYLRAAEYANDPLLSYESLIRLAICLEKQGSRIIVAKGVLLRAVAFNPIRPEAYFILSRLLERSSMWNEAYTYACIGLSNYKKDDINFKTDIEFYNEYDLLFEKAVAAWWIGLYSESIHLFRQVYNSPIATKKLKDISRNNINDFGSVWRSPIEYTHDLFDKLRIKFKGSFEINKNYSQCYQDMFVLAMLNGKRKGTYLEIGSGDPFFGNNTALLEKDFEWTGISIEIDQSKVNLFSSSRKNTVIHGDATMIDYSSLLKYSNYDYLQIDCDPALTSFKALMNVPLHNHKFAVITFEHDHYADEGDNVMYKARKYLESFGYVLVADLIAPDKYMPFEDWWIHPDLVDSNIVEKMKLVNNKVKMADQYMMEI